MTSDTPREPLTVGHVDYYYKDYKNLRYYLVIKQAFGSNAMQYCQSYLNGKLARIDADDEKEFVQNFASSLGVSNFWVFTYRGSMTGHELFVVDSGTRVDYWGKTRFMCVTELGNAYPPNRIKVSE
jgi:hypothetical protein